VYFHKFKGREILRSHNELNTTDDNVGLTQSFSTFTELCNVCVGICILFLKFILTFSILFLIKATCNKSRNTENLL
jgi:hypothetical protein